MGWEPSSGTMVTRAPSASRTAAQPAMPENDTPSPSRLAAGRSATGVQARLPAMSVIRPACEPMSAMSAMSASPGRVHADAPISNGNAIRLPSGRCHRLGHVPSAQPTTPSPWPPT